MFLSGDHDVLIRNKSILMLIMVVLKWGHASLGLSFDHANLMLKYWILIVLSLFWSSSNLLVSMLIFLVISHELERVQVGL